VTSLTPTVANRRISIRSAVTLSEPVSACLVRADRRV